MSKEEIKAYISNLKKQKTATISNFKKQIIQAKKPLFKESSNWMWTCQSCKNKFPKIVCLNCWKPTSADSLVIKCRCWNIMQTVHCVVCWAWWDKLLYKQIELQMKGYEKSVNTEIKKYEQLLKKM